ncbi:MAG: molybdopterin-dependent oxidoreductase [Acidobacteriia bacterium]|nr:molybdopterin-dependent oxidoreductase [Terriglobia bacterium]
MTRRDFFETLGGGILVFLVDDAIGAQESGRRGMNQPLPQNLGAWLHIGEDGSITAYTGKVEVGQNARTSLTQAVAEELRAPVPSIRLVMGDTDVTPYDMGTFGSRTTPTMWPQIRNAAATAREMLIDLAAQQWGVDRASVAIANGRAVSGARGAGFGELVKGRQLARTISGAGATPTREWKVAGTPVPKAGGRDIVTGAHKYPYDVKRPGALYAKVLYPPAFGCTLASLDSKEAEAIPGVRVVRESRPTEVGSPRGGPELYEGDFVAVAAPDPEIAAKALAALRPQWNPAPPQPNSGNVTAHFKQTAADAPAGFKPDAVYNVAYIAHVPLEPRAALAEWEDGKLTVWTGTQRPFGVRDELMSFFGLPPEQVRVIMPDTGSGYGGKHTADPALEAARIAKAAGKPVKRNWTREEEMTWAYFRPGGVIEAAGQANPDGTLAYWEFHNYNSGPAALQTPYHAAGAREQFHPSKSPLRQGSYRALAATANNFARESFMDELAHSAGVDPLEFRLKNASQDERLRNVIEAAAGRFGWKDRKRAAGRGFGMSAGFEKGGRVATCVEIAVERPGGAVKPVRVVEAFECGAVVNPEHLRNQIEGAVIMGLGGALFEHIDFTDGKILNNRLSRYRVPRFADVPAIEVVLLDRKDLPPAGAGETPIIGIAPALANAIFDATGQRIRSLPLAPNGLS